ncbi:ciliary microtubule associated protein 1B [Cottoperca gobio]|uniref:Ciliary microtubule associated protein 1B n=1 Tax=Cottoperca gobio TaxID=56716 RepID=A0A6J2PTH5_COTGO|nr:outer dense fiber protein 3-B-like [Cottoperca gobio]
MLIGKADVGTWRPHRPIGPISACYSNPGPQYALPGLTGFSKHDPTKYRAPMFSFGAHLDSIRYEKSPGPIYFIPSNITRMGQHNSPSFSLKSRLKDPALFQTPGPGTYSPEHADKSLFLSTPAFSISGRIQEISNIQTPGPASYILPPLLRHNTVATTFSKGGRSKIGSIYEDLNDNPGPAAYTVMNPYIYRTKPPQFSMTGRNFPPGDTTKKPGPGAHNLQQVTITRAKAPSFSFGIRHSEYIAPLIV